MVIRGVCVDAEAVIKNDPVILQRGSADRAGRAGRAVRRPNRFRLFPFDKGGARGSLNDDPERVRENTRDSLPRDNTGHSGRSVLLTRLRPFHLLVAAFTSRFFDALEVPGKFVDALLR